jgi:hypothetical protein
MKATLYMEESSKPVAELDEVKVVQMNDNHSKFDRRIFFKSSKLNASKVMAELHRDQKMTLVLDDGRSASVLLQHQSLDMQGNAVGSLTVLSGL